jgi:hypothetical protein
LVLLGATVALMIVGVVGVSALTGSGSDAGTLGMGDYGTESETTDSESDDYDTGSDDYDSETYDSSDGVGTPSAPSVSESTTAPPTSGGYDGYVVLPYADAWANGVENAFNAYFEGINNGDAQLAWMQLSPGWQQQTNLDDFAEAIRTSHDSDFVVHEASYTGGRADVWLEFTSTQDPELGPSPGEGCTIWSLDYVLLEQPDGTFLIDEVAGHGGTTGHSPC